MQQYQTLYKYRSLSGPAREHTASILKKNRLYYAAPGQFNDPFDCRFRVSMEGSPLTDWAKARESDIRAFTERWLYDKNNSEVCVLSLSEVRDDILMWSHYADCHTGVCLGIRVPLDNQQHRIAYNRAPAQLYLADLMPNHRDAARFAESIIGILTTKSEHWAYEREWRCIDFGGKGERPLPDNALVEVIFGCRTTDDDRNAVREWLGEVGSAVALFQAEVKDDEFGLDIRPL